MLINIRIKVQLLALVPIFFHFYSRAEDIWVGGNIRSVGHGRVCCQQPGRNDFQADTVTHTNWGSASKFYSSSNWHGNQEGRLVALAASAAYNMGKIGIQAEHPFDSGSSHGHGLHIVFFFCFLGLELSQGFENWYELRTGAKKTCGAKRGPSMTRIY
jgi:hypothetical protein